MTILINENTTGTCQGKMCTGLMKVTAALISVAILAGCAVDGANTAGVSKYDVRDQVSRIFNGACMKNLANLSRSKKALYQYGFGTVEKEGGTTYFINDKTSVLASAGDFSVTHKSGGRTLEKTSGYSCFVGSPLLTPNHAEEIVEQVVKTYLRGKTGFGRSKQNGRLTYMVWKGLIDKPFDISTVREFVEFDSPVKIDIGNAKTVNINGMTIIGVAVNVSDQ